MLFLQDPLITFGTFFSDTLSPLLLAFLLSLLIVYFYHRTNRGFSYENSFGFTLIMIAVIVTAVMVTISSNIALSLGLIGSLSIIRFRTAIKNSVDMAFIFWSIVTGLACGARNVPVAITTTLLLCVIVYAANKWDIFAKSNTDYILVTHFGGKCRQKDVDDLLSKLKLSWKLKSAHVFDKESEITYSIYSRSSGEVEKVVGEISKLKGMADVSLLTPETNLFI